MRQQLNDYEKELSGRDLQINDLEKQLRNFLDNNYELRDAVQEIRQMKEQSKLKDRQIEDLAQYASRNELLVHEVTDENEELRAKLGMEPRRPMSVDELKTARMTRTEANQAVVQVLQKEVSSIQGLTPVNLSVHQLTLRMASDLLRVKTPVLLSLD